MKQTINIFWFRRDLRLEDNHGLHEALKDTNYVLPVFIFDSEILEQLPKTDARVTFIYETLQNINSRLQHEFDSGVAIYHGKPLEIYKKLVKTYNIDSVYTNHDYEPYAKTRDTEIETILSENDINFKTFKDQVIFEKDEVVKQDGDPYVVYTPYMRTWKEKFKNHDLNIYYTNEYLDNLVKNTRLPNLTLSDMGFKTSSQKIADYTVTPTLIQEYEDKRNFPAKDATSKLGPHLRFGTVSVRKMVKKAIAEKNEIFWQELIWREFFMQILWHYPKTQTNAFKSKYDNIKWQNNKEEFVIKEIDKLRDKNKDFNRY
mgnify:CR=1 FL=1